MKIERIKNSLRKAAAPCLLALMTSVAVSAAPISAELDGKRLQFDQPPVMQEGRVLVPLRGIFESLGADVLYTPATKTIKATGNNNQVELTLGQRQALVNGKLTYLDVPAGTIGGRTMVPLRFVSEAMGADVDWRSATQTVAITSPTGTVGNDDNQSGADQPTASAPVINTLIHNARRPLRQGDILKVTMTGTPGAQANFGILGAIEGISMQEVSPGRYEGHLSIGPGMMVDDGTLVANLNANGRQTLKEADRAVTLASGDNVNTGPNYGYDVTPNPNQVVSQTRPGIRVNFGQSIRNQTLRVTLDGVDVTRNSTVVGDQVVYNPQWDLANGQHRVEVQAVAANGQYLTREWNFQVSDVAQNAPYLRVTNLTDGGSVPPVFNVQGQTNPYTTIQVEAQSQRSLIPGVIGVRGRTLRAQTTADANGHFDLQLDTSQLPSQSQLDLTVTPVDSSGRQGQAVELDLTRR